MKTFRNLAILSILLAFVLSGAVFAKPVNKTDAEKLVKGWLKADPTPLNAKLGGQVAEIQVYNGEDGSPAYYIVYLNPSGFVIVPADDLVEPVIGFVTGDAFYDPSPENPLGALVSRDIPGRVAAAKKLQKALETGKAITGDAIQAQKKWDKLKKGDTPIAPTGLPGISDVRVGPLGLIQTKWGQDYVCDDYCYNYYTPNHYYCGCTATAMAQIIRYMEYPTTGIGVHHIGSYDTRGGDGNGGAYNYGLMLCQPDCSITVTQRQQIGALCYDAGVAAYMDYGSGGSAAYIHDARAAFVNTFMYNNAIMGGNESTNIGSGLNGMMNPNLDAGVPVLLGISAGANAHAVVGDGYGYNSSTLYHHINMGWDGLDNAWYNLPTIDASYTYTTIFACIYNLYTSGNGEIISGRVTSSAGQPTIGVTVTATGPGGPYTTTTNSRGIYAFKNVSSNSTYAISVSATGCSFSPSSQNVTTGTSTNTAVTSGNVWGANFTSTCDSDTIEWVGANGTASPWETLGNWYDLDRSSAKIPTSRDIARLYNALTGYNFTDSNVTVSSTTAICQKLQMRYLVTKLTILTGGKLTVTGSVEMYQGTSGQIDIQGGSTLDACTKANVTTATFKLANDSATTCPGTVNIWGTLNIVSQNPANGTSDLQICNVSGGTGTGTINIYSSGVLDTEAYTIGSYGTGRIYITTGGKMKVTGNVTTQVNADIAAGKIVGAGGATLSVNYNSGENKTYVTASGGVQPPPIPPSITYPSSSDTGQYTVSWSSSSGATSYQLERSTDWGVSWSQIYSGENTSYDEDAGYGYYRYRVKATNSEGSSGWKTGAGDCVVMVYEGYDANGLTTGGSGGAIVHVTNLNSSGDGSLAAAIAGLSGNPTTIVFDVGGTIYGGIALYKANVTIAGETAPAPGITIDGSSVGAATVTINTHDVILRHLRIRNNNAGREIVQVMGDYRIIIDHCSISGGGDGLLDINNGTHDIIVSRCIFSDGTEAHRSYGKYASLHHNFYYSNNRRQPKIVTQLGPYDFRNNVLEAWTGTGTNIECMTNCAHMVNIINNYYGPNTNNKPAGNEFHKDPNTYDIYIAGNVVPAGHPDINLLGDRETPNEEPSVTTLPAGSGLVDNVKKDCGALPRDAYDESIAGPAGWQQQPPTGDWVQGSIHYHTTNSDGSESVETMVTTYRDTGGQTFSCVADHDYISDASAYTTETFLGINGVEASGGPHVVGFGVSGSGAVSYGSTLQAEIDSINAAGGLPMVAHPHWSQDNMGYDMPALLSSMTGCNLISVFNWYCEDLWGNGNSETYWDTLLSNGKVIYGYAEDDTHGLGRAGYTYNMVKVESLSAAAIKSALASGNSYFCYSVTKWAKGISVIDYTVSGTGTGDTISIATDRATSIQFIGSGGTVLSSAADSSATYTITGSEGYVRIKCTDSAGDITWMQPVFIGGGGPPPPDVTVTYTAGDASGWNLNDGTVIGQTIYGTAQDSSGNITANSYRYLSVDKGLAFVFGVSTDTVLDSITFKLRGLKGSNSMQVRMFNVSGGGYLDYGHTISRSSPGGGGTQIFDITTMTPSSIPSHDEAGAAATDMTIGFDSLSVTAGQYLICFDAKGPDNTWGNFVRGLATEADGMGKWPDGTNLPARATVTTSSATGNNYYYQLESTSAADYTPYSYQFAFQMRQAVECNDVPWEVSSPNPANGATNVNATNSITLRWAPGPCAESHDVYLGTSYNAVLNADHNSTEYKGNQTSTSYDAGTLSYDTTYYWSIDEINGYGTTAGAVWSFTTGPELPAAATSPNPSNSAAGVSVTADLSWTAGARATSHDVYFGTSSSPAFQTNQTGTTFDTGTMVGSTTYYWRIDEHNATGVTQGTLWSFTTEVTLPGQASSPAPANDATCVVVDTDLSWAAGERATSHDVYFGTSSPGAFQGNQTGTTFDPGTLAYETTYYWRIDEKNAAGTTTGQVWSFTTGPNLPAADYYVDTVNGNDNNSGTSLCAAFKTIGKAVTVVTAGKTVLVMPGTYAEYVNMNSVSGTAGNPITFRGYTDGGAVIIDATGKTHGIRCVKAYVIWDGFEVKNSNNNGIYLYSTAANHGEVRNCIVHNNSNEGIKVEGAGYSIVSDCVSYSNNQKGILITGANASNCEVHSCISHNNGTFGLRVYTADNVAVSDCLIYSNGDDGVNNADSADGTTFDRCTIYGSTHTGFYFSGSDATIRDCIIVGNGQWGIYVYGTCAINVDYSDTWNNTSGNYNNLTKITVGSYAISSNPLFVNPGSGDFHLGTGSPCIGTASDAGDMGYRY